ncbi:hypothetical protein JW921_07085, partial [Candidatus Fermentibacterales bacterium]|nr:hypothetical protein [Candidatus Fermentibacterales bacterium]
MSSPRDRAGDLLNTARKKVQSGDREEALDLLREALDLDPDHREVRQELENLEREIAAMTAFSRSRSRRVAPPHEGPAAVSSEDFIRQCLQRSQAALDEGDEVRALQELERAQRQDPENQNVRKRIRLVKRSIKAGNLSDLARTALKEGDVERAIAQARKLF